MRSIKKLTQNLILLFILSFLSLSLYTPTALAGHSPPGWIDTSSAKAYSCSNAEWTVSWENQNPGPRTYEVEWSTNGSSWYNGYNPTAATSGFTDTNWKQNGLGIGTRYYYRARSYYGGHWSNWSNSVNRVASAQTIPSAPTSVDATKSSTNPLFQVNIDWPTVSTVAGSTTWYNIKRYKGSGTSWSYEGSFQPSPSTSSYYENASLEPDTYYSYQVQAANACGGSSFVPTSIGTPGDGSRNQAKTDPARAPSWISSTPVSSTELSVSWESVAGASGYQVEQWVFDGSSWNPGPTYLTTASSFINSGLTYNSWYSYKVKTKYTRSGDGAVFWSDYSGRSGENKTATNITLTKGETTPFSITFSWNTNPGAKDVKIARQNPNGEWVYYDPLNPVSPWTANPNVTHIIGASGSLTDSSLMPSTSYIYRVFAYDGDGLEFGKQDSVSWSTDALSYSIDFSRTATSAFSIDFNFTTTPYASKATLARRTRDAAGNPSAYVYYQKEADGTVSWTRDEVSATYITLTDGRFSFTDSSLMPSSEYQYQVKAFDSLSNLGAEALSPWWMTDVLVGGLFETEVRATNYRVTYDRINVYWETFPWRATYFKLARTDDGASWAFWSDTNANGKGDRWLFDYKKAVYIGPLFGGMGSFSDTSVVSSSTHQYQYRVFAYDAVLEYGNYDDTNWSGPEPWPLVYNPRGYALGPGKSSGGYAQSYVYQPSFGSGALQEVKEGIRIRFDDYYDIFGRWQPSYLEVGWEYEITGTPGESMLHFYYEEDYPVTGFKHKHLGNVSPSTWHSFSIYRRDGFQDPWSWGITIDGVLKTTGNLGFLGYPPPLTGHVGSIEVFAEGSGLSYKSSFIGQFRNLQSRTPSDWPAQGTWFLWDYASWGYVAPGWVRPISYTRFYAGSP